MTPQRIRGLLAGLYWRGFPAIRVVLCVMEHLK